MINWLKNQRTKKEVERLEKTLLDKLSSHYPSMNEIYNNSKLQSFAFSKQPPGITLQHSITADYYDKNKKKHGNFKIDGFEIKKRSTNEFVKLTLTVTTDLIQTIEIDGPENFWKNYEIDQVKADKLQRTELILKNEDADKLMRVLKNIGKALKDKIEIDDTFEIKLEDKTFYTILDMEDGNYIGVNSKGEVFRLLHDSYEQAVMINKSISSFLITYSGNKDDLIKHFED